jgi:hypothetical protein
MRTFAPTKWGGSPEATGTIAAPGAGVAGMLRRSGTGLAVGPRRPPVGRRLRAVAVDAVPVESRIVFRAGAVALR